MPNYTIYALHLSTDPTVRYVGYTTKPVTRRLAEHRRDALAGSRHIKHKWMRKHGVENIRIRVLEDCPVGDYDYLSYAERYWIEAMRELGHDLLNQTPGGIGGRGSTHSEATRAKMRASAPRTSGPEHHMFGVKQDPDHVKRRIAKAAKARWTPEAREAQRQTWIENNPMAGVRLEGELNGFFGKNHTEDTRARMSESAKNRPPISDETRMKMRVRNHNRWHTNRDITKPDCEFC